jgi:hypothetical protein
MGAAIRPVLEAFAGADRIKLSDGALCSDIIVQCPRARGHCGAPCTIILTSRSVVSHSKTETCCNPAENSCCALSQLNCLHLRRVVHELHDLHSRTPSSSALPFISCIDLDHLTRAWHTRTVVHTRTQVWKDRTNHNSHRTTFLPTITHWPALTCCTSYHPLATQRRACDCRAVLTHVCPVSCDAQHSGPRYCGWTLLCRALRAMFTG